MKSLPPVDYPKFTVVGHPNKGKSSIVSALTLDDSVQISDTPGTTTKTRSFPLSIDGKVLYELYDTPGFQRARQVLSWLNSQNVPIHKRPEAIRRFVQMHRDDPKFADEVELLSPIIDGAVIIYVVDGSKPYGPEYEAEMEILRWSGEPSMALINLVGEGNYVDEWKGVLGQYFKIIRQFDPMKRSFDDHISLLEGVAQLKEEWIEPLKATIGELKGYRDRLIDQTAGEISSLIKKSIGHIESVPYSGEGEQKDEESKLMDRYQDRLRGFERDAQRKVEKIWHHTHIDKDQIELSLEGVDLFAKESESIFGLTRQEMVYAGMATGAATGAGVDLLLAGHTLLIGGMIGAAVGGAGAYMGFDKLSEVRILGTKIGRQRLEIGPMENRNFPYILLGRAIYHAYKVASRSHALRGKLDLQMDSEFRDKWMDSVSKKVLEKYHKKFRSQESIDGDELKTYEETISTALGRVI